MHEFSKPTSVKKVFVFALTITLALFPVRISAAQAVLTDEQSTTESAVVTTAAPNDPATTDTSVQSSEPLPNNTLVPPAEQQTPPPVPSIPGPTSPNGADAKKYVYNPDTGLWESDKYTWNPTTHQTAPKQPVNYSYNPTTGMWDTTQWIYDAPSGTYKPNIVSTPPEEVPQALKQEASALSQPDATPTRISSYPEQYTSGPESQQSISNHSSSNGSFSLFYNASISNTISSRALSGNATVTQNTIGGNALTGDALVQATVMSLLQSGWNPSASGSFTTFNALFSGNIYGDLVLDPATVGNHSSSDYGDLDVVAIQNGSITNNINVAAQSGDALISKNSSAGNAETGDATALVNVINLINSAISAGQSFVGSITVNGSLDGDILLPPGVLENLLAQQRQQNTASNDNMSITTNTTSTTDNSVQATATSGNATVAGNTSAGSATTGDGATKVNIINLTGQQVVGKNAMIVFVNVFGQWTGLIVDAPQGATTALLGSAAAASQEQNANYDMKTNHTITNNIIATATSGDATVHGNTSAGNATTGDTNVGVNIANLSNSNLSLTDWFGILFITIMGDWNGSFGTDTIAGELPTEPPAITPPAPTPLSMAGSQPSSQVLSVMASQGTTPQRSFATPVATLTPLSTKTSSPEVLSSQSQTPPPFSAATYEEKVAGANDLRYLTYGGLVIALLLVLGEEILRLRRRTA